jgi:peptidoglycan L-alanyl-D-glutamate endopeptidase CwlK
VIDYKADPTFWQRFLKCAGFYRDNIDGDFGPNSTKAALEFEQASLKIAREDGSFDKRSEANIQTLLPSAQRKARQFMKAVLANGITIKLISGTRTFREQDKLYEQGRTLPGKRVTNARGGASNNFGVAWDIGVFEDAIYLDESFLYRQAGDIGKALNLEWGGDWKNFSDEPHFQVVREDDLKEIASKFQQGIAFV